jgi:hypothetical protein
MPGSRVPSTWVDSASGLASDLLFEGSQPFANGILNQVGYIRDTKLMHYLLAMKFNGFDAYIQHFRNAASAFAFGQELEYLALPRSQDG